MKKFLIEEKGFSEARVEGGLKRMSVLLTLINIIEKRLEGVSAQVGELLRQGNQGPVQHRLRIQRQQEQEERQKVNLILYTLPMHNSLNENIESHILTRY